MIRAPKVRKESGNSLFAPIVEWLAHISDKDEIKVQFLVGVQNGK